MKRRWFTFLILVFTVFAQAEERPKVSRRALCGFALVSTLAAAVGWFSWPDRPIDLGVQPDAHFPDLSQRDPSFGFYDQGEMACGPCAAANGLIYLSQKGFPDVMPKSGSVKDLVTRIDALSLRKEAAELAKLTGTFDFQLSFAIERYLKETPYKDSEVTTLSPVNFERSPELNEIKTALRDPASVVMLSLTWFKKDEAGRITLDGGHWVTATGYQTRPNGTVESFTVSDPDDGVTDPEKRLSLSPLEGKEIWTRRNRILPVSHFWKLGKGILDNAIIITLKK